MTLLLFMINISVYAQAEFKSDSMCLQKEEQILRLKYQTI